MSVRSIVSKVVAIGAISTGARNPCAAAKASARASGALTDPRS